MAKIQEYVHQYDDNVKSSVSYKDLDRSGEYLCKKICNHMVNGSLDNRHKSHQFDKYFKKDRGYGDTYSTDESKQIRTPLKLKSREYIQQLTFNQVVDKENSNKYCNKGIGYQLSKSFHTPPTPLSKSKIVDFGDKLKKNKSHVSLSTKLCKDSVKVEKSKSYVHLDMESPIKSSIKPSVPVFIPPNPEDTSTLRIEHGKKKTLLTVKEKKPEIVELERIGTDESSDKVSEFLKRNKFAGDDEEYRGPIYDKVYDVDSKINHSDITAKDDASVVNMDMFKVQSERAFFNENHFSSSYPLESSKYLNEVKEPNETIQDSDEKVYEASQTIRQEMVEAKEPEKSKSRDRIVFKTSHVSRKPDEYEMRQNKAVDSKYDLKCFLSGCLRLLYFESKW